MKKIVAIVLSLVLALTVLCCGAFAENADITGEWYGDMYGAVVIINIAEDGTYTLDVMGETDSGTWVWEDGCVVMDKGTEEEAVVVYDAEAQTLNMYDELILGREPIEVYAPAAATVAESAEAFAGSWTATHVNAFGALLPVDAAGIYMDAAIEGTAVTLTMNFVGEEIFAGEAVFADGVLTLTIPADEYTEEQVFTISVLEDGTISVATVMFEDAAVFYMAAAEN